MRKRSAALIIAVLVMLSFSLTLHVQAALPSAKHIAAESSVELQNQGQTIRGTLTMPKAEGPFPVVIIFHGFSGQRHEMPVVGTDEALFQRTARVLAEQGYASLRIDFRGSGESDGQWADTTFSGQISDALAAVDYVCGLDELDPNRVAVLGLSQGGLVAAATAGRDRRVASAVLWSAVASPSATYADLLGADAVLRGLNCGVDDLVTAALPWGATTTLKGSFFRDLYIVDPVAEITAYKGPLLVIVGLNDTIVSPQPQSGEIYLAYHQGDEALVQLDADHMFDCLARPEKVDEAICATIGWLDKTL
ncbi:MAG: alpha/beta fold hydrolase [Clostridia bacterium]|nr:alpha/beta fold hydrolase [Clostridia bacterium]